MGSLPRLVPLRMVSSAQSTLCSHLAGQHLTNKAAACFDSMFNATSL